jgi:uncharacterized protein UPF0158
MKVSYSDLEDAFLTANYETQQYWLDKHTGRVLAYSTEAAEALEGDLSDLPDWMADDLAAAREVLSFFGEIPDEVSQQSGTSGQSSVGHPLAAPGSMEAGLDSREASAEDAGQNTASDTGERTGTSLSEASTETQDHTIGANDPNRYVPIEQIPSNDAFQFMSDFADEVADWRIRDVLQRALRGNRPFRRFKDEINCFPEERERWFAYESIRRRDYIEGWAREVGIEIAFSSDVS